MVHIVCYNISFFFSFSFFPQQMFYWKDQSPTGPDLHYKLKAQQTGKPIHITMGLKPNMKPAEKETDSCRPRVWKPCIQKHVSRHDSTIFHRRNIGETTGFHHKQNQRWWRRKLRRAIFTVSHISPWTHVSSDFNRLQSSLNHRTSRLKEESRMRKRRTETSVKPNREHSRTRPPSTPVLWRGDKSRQSRAEETSTIRKQKSTIHRRRRRRQTPEPKTGRMNRYRRTKHMFSLTL